MNIEINESEAKELLEWLAVLPASAITSGLYDRITLALEMRIPTANLQPKDDLKFATLGVAQNIVKRVASGISNTEAYLDLQRVVAMLETAMERTPETPEQERARKIRCLRAQAEYVRDLLDVCAAEALHKIADELEALP